MNAAAGRFLAVSTSRFQDYLLRAMSCERMAGIAMDNGVKTIYLDLAAQWRVLARQAEMWDMDRDGQLLRILSDAGRRLRGD